MPWANAKAFSKHNKNSKGAVGNKAARIATGLLNQGASDGKAIRIANSYIKKHKGRRQK